MQCPHCLQHYHADWAYKGVVQELDKTWWVVGSVTCPACYRVSIALGRGKYVNQGQGNVLLPNGPMPLAYPKTISRVPLPAEVPIKFSLDYTEACLVLADSEKASAALSRRCLQHLLREKLKVKRGDLATEIQQVLDARSLPTHLAEDLDAIRNIGNFAAHPLKSTNTGEVVDVEPHEAEWLLTVLEGLFDFCFVQPARAQAKRDALNLKLQAIGKPPMKSPA
jgi:hypothetical protein